MSTIRVNAPSIEIINGYQVKILRLTPGRWCAEYTGKDGQLVRIFRATRGGIITGLEMTMRLRKDI